ncbi:hypothetical protein F5Y17DRAFT_470725 [Xylariaceae sp. FL0594]|nr:hypothetical protein F5Y17DRAFT_470725 [Xylariaceae sp. FL0594]
MPPNDAELADTLRWMEYIADQHKCTRDEANKIPAPRSTAHDPVRLFTLVHCTSIGMKYKPEEHPQVAEFAAMVREQSARGTEGLDDESLADMFGLIYDKLCQLFFFDLPLRQVKNSEGEEGALVRLITVKRHDGTVVGLFDPVKCEVMVMIRSGSGVVRCYEEYLNTILHELIHAFLEIFADRSHPRDEELRGFPGGHGVYFWVFYLFIMTRIYILTQYEGIREQWYTLRLRLHNQIKEHHLGPDSKACFQGCPYNCEEKTVRRSVPSGYLDLLWEIARKSPRPIGITDTETAAPTPNVSRPPAPMININTLRRLLPTASTADDMEPQDPPNG